MSMSLLIKNAVIINTEKIAVKPQDILIEKGVITKIATTLKRNGCPIFDAKGRFVLPGLVDIHVHLREPGREDKETIATGSQAAARGGFTTIMCMPNTQPVIDHAMIVQSIIKEARRVGLVNVIPHGAITRGQLGEELADMSELKDAGCLALSDDGKTVANSQLMMRALEYAKMVDILLIEHCQDPQLSCRGVMNEGFVSTLLGFKGDPGPSETVIVGRDIELAYYLKTKIHLAHMSLRRSIELIRRAKNDGVQVTAEATPHHFTLTDEAVKSFDTNTKVNPSLRTQDDVEAVKQGLKDGTIDCIVTDHAPHTYEDKEVDYEQSPFGLIGLETAVGLTVSELVEKGVLTWPQMVKKMSTAPARIVGLKNKGEIREGWDADLTIIDPEKEWVVSKEEIVSKSKNSPFVGRTLKGVVEATVYQGKIVYQADKLIGER